MSQNFPPDPRYGTNALLGTSGQPPESIGTEGDLASDADEGSLYIKTTDGWKLVAVGVEV